VFGLLSIVSRSTLSSIPQVRYSSQMSGCIMPMLHNTQSTKPGATGGFAVSSGAIARTSPRAHHPKSPRIAGIRRDPDSMAARETVCRSPAASRMIRSGTIPASTACFPNSLVLCRSLSKMLLRHFRAGSTTVWAAFKERSLHSHEASTASSCGVCEERGRGLG
jgi:hypothetical protein